MKVAGLSGDLRKRYKRILIFASLVLAENWWFEIFLPSIGLGKLGAKNRVERLRRSAAKFRVLATELTGLMIKVGQFISSRLDILPYEITKELDGLQDKVAPEPFDAIRLQVSENLGIEFEEAFESMDSEPIAAASLGQVHIAHLSARLAQQAGFERVVVKVLRPGIEEIVAVDLAALRKIAGWLSRVKLISNRADAPALIEEFATTTLQEIDYLNESANLERFRTDFANDEFVGVPDVVWERTSRKVLTLSDVSAIKVSDSESLRNHGIDPNRVAIELARITFQQIFVNGFFHADPHPGNIFVTPQSNSGGFKLTFIDFGMMGELYPEQQANLRRFIFAVASRDAQGWVSSVRSLKLLLPNADTVQLEIAIDALFERFGGVSVGELISTDPKELRDFALQFGELIRALPFQVPENFLLLVRAVSIVSGVCSSINTDFNIWNSIDPFARTLSQRGTRSALSTFGADLVNDLAIIAKLPKRMDEMLRRLQRGEFSVRNPELEKRMRRVQKSQSQISSALYFIALFSGGLILRLQGDLLGNWLIGLSSVPLIVSWVMRRLP